MKPGSTLRTNSNQWPSIVFFKNVLACSLCSLLAAGCVAQQADLARIQKDLEQQIAKIKDEKKALGNQVDEARSAISESQSLLAQQKAEMTQMQKILAKRSDFADLHQKVTLIREQDLRVLYGKNEEAEKRLNDLEKSLKTQTDDLQSEIQTLQNTTQSQGDQIQASQARTEVLAQETDATNQALTNTMTEFQQSLAQFKDALGNVETQVRTQGEQLTAQRSKMASHDDKLRNLDAASQELFQSLTQLRQAVEASATLAGERLDEQGGQINQLQHEVGTLPKIQQNIAGLPQLYQEVKGLQQELTGLHQDVANLPQLQQEVAGLYTKLDKDTQALKTYLEHDVKGAMAQLVNEVDKRQEPVMARIDSLHSDMEALATHVQADAAHVQDLSQTVLKLREAQEVMGSLLGKRGDEIIQQAGRLTERMNTVESHQTALSEQLQSNTQKTSDHLAGVQESLNSVSQALDQTNKTLSARLAKQEEAVQTLNQTRQQFQQLTQHTQDQIQQMQSAGQLTDQLRKTVEEISSRLHKLEIHQSGLVGKLDSDAQVTNTHLQEVNSGIKSVAQALENVSSKLNTRIDDQEQRLNRAMTNFQKVQGTADISQNNVNHLNQLTDTVNQLREVVNTIGTKLGERVDQHEDRLGQLAQRVNRLQGAKTQK